MEVEAIVRNGCLQCAWMKRLKNRSYKEPVTTAKDLTKEAPRSPRTRLGDYAIMARMIDKGRATLNGTAGEYHYACPIDQSFFTYKGVEADDVKALLASGASDERVLAWFNEKGAQKTADETKAWSAGVESYSPHNDPGKKNGSTVCARLSDLIPRRAVYSISSKPTTGSALGNKHDRNRTRSEYTPPQTAQVRRGQTIRMPHPTRAEIFALPGPVASTRRFAQSPS
jgi:hypothetical protein